MASSGLLMLELPPDEPGDPGRPALGGLFPASVTAVAVLVAGLTLRVTPVRQAMRC